MNLLEWYLQLSFFDAVLVWLKLLLPVLFLLTVAMLVSVSLRWFGSEMRLPRPKLPNPKPRQLRDKKDIKDVQTA